MGRIQGRKKSHSDRLDYPESRKKWTSGQFGSVSWPAGRRSDRPEVEQADSSPEILTSQNIDDVERGVQEQRTMVIIIGFAPENYSRGSRFLSQYFLWSGYVHHAEAYMNQIVSQSSL